MQSTNTWFTPLATVAGAFIGAVSAIIAALLTQKQDLTKQLALRKLDHEEAARQTILKEKQQRYLTILQLVESLYSAPQADISARRELLKAIRESWLFGDDDLVRAIGNFLNQIAGTPAEPSAHEVEIGRIVLLMRKDLGLQPGTLTTSDFRFHSAGQGR